MATTANEKPSPEPIPRRRFGIWDLWRVGLWGIAATAAVCGAVFASSSDVAEDRLMLAVAYLRGAMPSPAQLARNNETETHRLAAAVRTLSADRDRLQTRLNAIEHNVEGLTGSIARNSAESAASPPPPAPAIAPPETMPIVNVPVPRPAPSPATPPDVTPQVEFGIDLGGATNIEGLRAIWAAAKSRHGALLENLRPIMTVRESTRPGGVELRIVAGPLANASLAARLCGAFANSGAACQPAVFDGQRLAFSETTPKR